MLHDSWLAGGPSDLYSVGHQLVLLLVGGLWGKNFCLVKTFMSEILGTFSQHALSLLIVNLTVLFGGQIIVKINPCCTEQLALT